MPRVFICHATLDRDFVEREVVGLLNQHGLETWYSKDNIQTAEEWERSILKGLKACDWFLIVLSTHSQVSEWVKDELNWAIKNRRDRIVPVLIEACDSSEFHLRLDRIQFADFRVDPEEGRRRLLACWGIVPEQPGRGAPARSFVNSLGMTLVRIEPGWFVMGSGDYDDEKPHAVQITKAFYLGAHQVTQGQYEAVMGTNPSQFKGSDDLPVESVSWFDAVAFCNKLSERENRKPRYQIEGDAVTNLGGDGYRLPTEAEWEYACRAGSTTRYPFGDNEAELGSFAWFEGNSDLETHPVGQRRPNGWGLYDMLGNVLEWCWDGCAPDYYKNSPPDDPAGPPGADARVLRGGGWLDLARYCRPAYRDRATPETRGSVNGFRVAAVQEG
jgi:formylglycine-generating enzyme required for sulfatase activity